MKEICIPQNIGALRKKRGITQEQLATALNITPQAVSKWETGVSQPDVQTIPLIADFFGVSIDYLYYGDEIVRDEIYEKVYDYVNRGVQMSRESYENALRIFGHAHHGISCGNLWKEQCLSDEPAHISNENGLSLFSAKGYGAILTRDFFETMDVQTVDLAEALFAVLSNKDRLRVCMAIIAMSDIGFYELQEQMGTSSDALRALLDELIAASIVVEEKSKHKALGFTYTINSAYHTCLCLLVATVEMQKSSLNGISCCMGYGDYPISL